MFLRVIARVLSFCYPKRIIDGIEGFNRLVISEYYARRLKKTGKNIRLFSPVIVKGEKYIEIGDSFSADRGFVLQCWDSYAGKAYNPSILIGDNAHFGMDSHISAINKITIGDNLLTGKNCYISDHSHIPQSDSIIPPIDRPLFSKGEVKIGDNVWFGDNVSILPGVSIGNNVIVGANSVVTKDVEDNMVVAGVPAHNIKRINEYYN